MAADVAGDDDVARTEEVGDPDAARWRWPPSTSSSTSAGSSSRTLTMPLGRGVGGGLHRLAAFLHHAQAVGEAQRAGEDQGGVLAQAQPGGGDARRRRASGSVCLSASRAARLAT